MANFPKFDIEKFEKEILHKPETLGVLGALGGNVVDFAKYYHSLTEDERMNYEERAAIMEYDGGLTRADAEKQALENVIYIRDYKNGKQ